jgi:cell fate (sporulation/competence/biofilm development) regulator YmcA (YheA/YmcA/DUF963 family)
MDTTTYNEGQAPEQPIEGQRDIKELEEVKYYTQSGELVTDEEKIKKFEELMKQPIKCNRNFIDWSNPENRF